MVENTTNQDLLRGQYGHLTNLAPKFGKIIAEYIWVDGSGIGLRSKSRTLLKKVTNLNEIPDWNFDGSSSYMANTENSEIILKPVAFFPDPFRCGDNILVMCETFMWKDTTY
jgi:glutamine synthetase